MLCVVVTRAPTSHLAGPALEQLDNATSLFDSASKSCRSADKLLVSLIRTTLAFIFPMKLSFN